MITFMIAEIAVEAGWAVGAVPAGDDVLDRDLLLDLDGLPWAPGSTLAGSLRAHVADRDPELETALFGSRPPAGARQDAELDPSPLWLLGTTFTPSGTTSTSSPGPDCDGGLFETVGQTAIDRRRGAARPTMLRTSRNCGVGGLITVYLRHTGVLDDRALRAIASWRPAVGRGRTTGGGRAELRTLRVGQIDPGTSEGLRTWLRHSGPELVRAVATRDVPVTGATTPPRRREMTLEIEDTLLVGQTRLSGPATPRRRRDGHLVPGTAWKGLFRSRVEYILRSRYPDAAIVCDAGLDCPERDTDCPACVIFGNQRRRGLLAFGDSTIVDPIVPPARTHVAIDRVTGGARDKLLFQTQPITRGRVTLCIDALGETGDWVWLLLDHVLRDLYDGLIGAGSRANRGMGTLRLVGTVPTPGPVVVPETVLRRCPPAPVSVQEEPDGR